MMSRVAEAVRRASPYSITIFVTFACSASVGAVMVHSGNRFALARRDAIVAAASRDKISTDYRAGRRLRAALRDAAANFGLAAVPQTVTGLTVVMPYVTVSRQGWIGGIVSVDAQHASRLRSRRGAFYYVGVLLLQFLAFSVCIGGGVRCGVTLYEENREVGWRFWRYRLARASVRDLALVVCASIPLFLIASTFEFLVSTNV